jgi:hypothetical protein
MTHLRGCEKLAIVHQPVQCAAFFRCNVAISLKHREDDKTLDAKYMHDIFISAIRINKQNSWSHKYLYFK